MIKNLYFVKIPLLSRSMSFRHCTFSQPYKVFYKLYKMTYLYRIPNISQTISRNINHKIISSLLHIVDLLVYRLQNKKCNPLK